MDELEKVKEQKEQEAVSLYEMMGIFPASPTPTTYENQDVSRPVTILLSHNSHPIF